MKPFTDTLACRSRKHCGTCRDLVGGRAWRESLGRLLALPGDATDFPCPHGLPWNPSAVQLAAAGAMASAEQAIRAELAKARFAVCLACPRSMDAGFACELHPKCCLGSDRARPGYSCPDSPPRWGPGIDSPLH